MWYNHRCKLVLGDDMKMEKLSESEYRLIELVWDNEPVTARQLGVLAADRIGWNRNTTYTIIRKLTEKKYVLRSEPDYTCVSLVKKDDIISCEINEFINKYYDGLRERFTADIQRNRESNHIPEGVDPGPGINTPDKPSGKMADSNEMDMLVKIGMFFFIAGVLFITDKNKNTDQADSDKIPAAH